MLIFVYSYEKEYIENIKCQPQNRNYHIQASVSRKEKVLEINKQPISKENFEVVELKLKIALTKILMKRSKKRRFS